MADRKGSDGDAVSAPLAALGADAALTGFAAADSPAAIARLARNIGFRWCFWQTWEPETVHTWESMPSGFLAHYYGIQADRFCPVAVAIRRRWQTFTFREARELLISPYAEETRRVWSAFGIEDGAVVFGGRGAGVSALILCADKPVESTFLRFRAALSLAAVRMDELLRRHPGLTAIERDFIRLTEKQLAVLRVQIDHPELSFAEQAELLAISPRMLEKRHRQIADRFGVSSFTAAVAKALADGIGLG